MKQAEEIGKMDSKIESEVLIDYQILEIKCFLQQ